MGLILKSSHFKKWDFPWNKHESTIQLLGILHDYGDTHNDSPLIVFHQDDQKDDYDSMMLIEPLISIGVDTIQLKWIIISTGTSH